LYKVFILLSPVFNQLFFFQLGEFVPEKDEQKRGKESKDAQENKGDAKIHNSYLACSKSLPVSSSLSLPPEQKVILTYPCRRIEKKFLSTQNFFKKTR